MDLVHDRIIPALKFLRAHQPPEPYYGAFSGGKDSIVIKHLSLLAGVSVEWHYHDTTIDPPELRHFIHEHHPDVAWERPVQNFFVLMEKRGFPSRRSRWCCEVYKERSCPGAVVITGVRKAEGSRRAAFWKDVRFNDRSKNWMVAPILEWSTEEVWQFIRAYQLPYCGLYDRGFTRLGCIGCPLAFRQLRKELSLYPKFEKLWQRSFRRLWERRKGSKSRDGRPWFGERHFENWEQLWEWYLSGKSAPPAREACQFLPTLT